MKLYIKTLALGLLLGTTLVSCNSNYEEGDAIVYPEHPELGIYTNEYVKDDGASYTVNLTLNEQGDTICDVTTYNASAESYNTFSAGKVSYDKSVGIITADYEDSPYECPARVIIAYKNDLQGLTVNVYSNDGKLQIRDYFNAIKTENISYYGDWQLKDGSILSLSPDGTASVSVDGEETGSGSYSINGSSVTATVNGKTYTLNTNAQGQTYDSSNSYIQHILTQPKEDWYEYAVGYMTFWVFSGQSQESVLEYSNSRKMARITPLLGTGSYMSFYWKIGDSTVTADQSSYNSKWTYQQDGQVYGEVYVYPTSASYANGIFTFNTTWQIPGVGGFGSGVDTFTITSLLE